MKTNYTEEQLLKAVQSIQNESLSLRKISNFYGAPPAALTSKCIDPEQNDLLSCEGRRTHDTH